MRSTLRILGLSALCAFGATVAIAADAPPAPRADLSLVPSGSYTLDSKHANLIWRINHLGLSIFPGRFDSLEGTLTLNKDKPELSKVEVTAMTASISTHVSDLDAHLIKPDFFDAKKYPKITFVSKKITVTGKNTGTIEGDVTMHGVTKPLTLDATLIGAGFNGFAKMDVVGISAKGKIKRSDFGLMAYLPMVGDEVELQIDAEFDHEAGK